MNWHVCLSSWLDQSCRRVVTGFDHANNLKSNVMARLFLTNCVDRFDTSFSARAVQYPTNSSSSRRPFGHTADVFVSYEEPNTSPGFQTKPVREKVAVLQEAIRGLSGGSFEGP